MHQLGAATDAQSGLAGPGARLVDGRGADIHLHRFVRRPHDPRTADRADQSRPVAQRHADRARAGMAFGLFYAAMGLPLGWLADRTSRRGLIAVGADRARRLLRAGSRPVSFSCSWRASPSASARQRSPAAMSIISDSFPKERRAVPIGVYAAAAALGAGLCAHRRRHRDSTRLEPLANGVVFVGLGGLVLLPLLATSSSRRDATSPRLPARRCVSTVCSRACGFHGPSLRRGLAVLGHDLCRAQLGSRRCSSRARLDAGRDGLRYGVVLLLFGGAGTVLGGIAAAQLGNEACSNRLSGSPSSAWRSRGRCSRWADGPRMAGPRWHGMRRRSYL